MVLDEQESLWGWAYPVLGPDAERKVVRRMKTSQASR